MMFFQTWTLPGPGRSSYPGQYLQVSSQACLTHHSWLNKEKPFCVIFFPGRDKWEEKLPRTHERS